jgi:hypothetical protein
MTERVLKLWETEWSDYQDRVAVPGGWALVVYSCDDFGRRITPGTAIRVDDPTAPHCQPTPPADDRPPMTDDALRAWLTATYDGPGPNDPDDHTQGDLWWLDDGKMTWAVHRHNEGWSFGCWDVHSPIIPAHIAGPALWAAHRYGAAE